MKRDGSRDGVLLAVDLGSSSARAMFFDMDCVPVTPFEARRSYSVETGSDGRATLDAESLVAACVAVAGECGGRLQGRKLVGVGLSVFMHGLVGVGSDGLATTPVLMWSDTRSGAESAEVARRLGADDVLRRSGCHVHTSFAPSKLLWMQRHERAVFDRTTLWLSAGDYVTFRLFGKPSASLSMASSLGLVDVSTGDWDAGLLRDLGLGSVELAPIRPYNAPFEGVIDGRLRDALGRAGDVPWLPASADGACSNVGSGATDRSVCALNVGTSAALRVLAPSLSRSVSDGLWCYLTNDGTPYIGGALSNAGNLIAWIRERFSLDDWAALEGHVSQIEPDSHGLTMLPFLYGERAPGWNADAAGAIVGLRSASTGADVVRAAMETVGLRLRMILDRVESHAPDIRRVVAGGGGLRSRVWAQIISDSLGVPLWTSSVIEPSARGAAVFGLHALGLLDDVGSRPPDTRILCEPDPKAVQHYEAAKERHVDLYQRLAGRATR